MCIFLSLLCSLSCVATLLDTTRDLAFRDRTLSLLSRYFPTSGIKARFAGFAGYLGSIKKGSLLFVLGKSRSRFLFGFSRVTIDKRVAV